MPGDIIGTNQEVQKECQRALLPDGEALSFREHQGVSHLHTLDDHVPPLLEFWFNQLGWGYGYFACTSSERLNKLLQEAEYTDINF